MKTVSIGSWNITCSNASRLSFVCSLEIFGSDCSKTTSVLFSYLLHHLAFK